MMCGGELLQVGTFIGIVTFFIWRGGAIHQGDNKGGSEMLWSRVKNVSAPGCCWGRFLIRSLPVDRRRLRSLNGWQAVADQNYEAVFAGLSYGIQTAGPFSGLTRSIETCFLCFFIYLYMQLAIYNIHFYMLTIEEFERASAYWWQTVADQHYEAVFPSISFWTIQWSCTILRNWLHMFGSGSL